MKKRLFLFLALIVAICALFAISASARTYTEGNDVYVVTVDNRTIKVTTYDDFTMPTNLTYRADDIVVFDDGFACPSIYIFKDSTEIKSGAWQNNGLQKALDFSLYIMYNYCVQLCVHHTCAKITTPYGGMEF